MIRMLLSLGLSDISLWLDLRYLSLGGVAQKGCSVLLIVLYQVVPDFDLPIASDVNLDQLVKVSDLSSVKLLFSPFSSITIL